MDGSRPQATPGTAAFRRERRTRIDRLAAVQGGVVSRRQLLVAGLNRWEITAELRSGRWRVAGRQTVGITPTTPGSAWWWAVFEVGADAALDGSSALAAAGLRHYSDELHVSVSRGTRYRRPRGE